METIVLQMDFPKKAQVTNVRRHGPEQVLGGEVQYGDSMVSMATCDTVPFADVASIIPQTQNPARISYSGLEFQQSQPIDLVPADF